MKRGFTLILLGSLALSVFIILTQLSVINESKEKIHILENKPDTIFKKVIKVPVPYPVYQKPEKVIIYRDTGSVKYNTARIHSGKILLFNTGLNDTMSISQTFLTKYPKSEKLISLSLSEKDLDLQLLTLSGMTIEKKYDIDTRKYKYRYVNNELSVKPYSYLKIYPELEYEAGLLRNIHNVNFGLKLETSRFNYVIGITGYYNSLLPNQFGYDVTAKVRYTFFK